MADKRKHRGQHPNDKRLFGERFVPNLQQATKDLSWLFSRGYAEKSSLKLVGDRFKLTERQRRAIQGAACSNQNRQLRLEKEVDVKDLVNSHVFIDGFNLLIILESALSNGFLFRGRDGCYRDLASVHGTYKKVLETTTAIEWVGKIAEQLKVNKITWYFDQPVSNSGRLKVLLYEIAVQYDWNWEIQLVYNPDKELIQVPALAHIIVSSDAMVLDGAKQWFNLGAYIIDRVILPDYIVDLNV